MAKFMDDKVCGEGNASPLISPEEKKHRLVKRISHAPDNRSAFRGM